MSKVESNKPKVSSGPVKPKCFDRPPFVEGHEVQEGWRVLNLDGSVRFSVSMRVPLMRIIPNQNTRGCSTHWNGEAAYHKFDCRGCRWTKVPFDCTPEQETKAVSRAVA